MLNGSLPFTHIAEVQAVSFTGPEMRIRLISIYPAVELPIYYLPEGGVQGDQLQARETVEAYYHPAVPRDPFPPEYNPEIDDPPQVMCEYISARYFDVAEKVIVIQDGRDFWVISQIKPDDINYVGSEIAHEQWISQMNGAVFIPYSETVEHSDEEGWFTLVNFLTEENTIYRVPTNIPLAQLPYQNYNLVQSLTKNKPFPIFVFPREPLVHLNTVDWTWAGGAYNYAYQYQLFAPYQQKDGGKFESFKSPTVVFPCKHPDIRLEIQASDEADNLWSDALPDLEFYTTSSGINVKPIGRDFVNNDDHVELVLNIERPWGTVLSNPEEWKTSNWVPPILFAPDDSLSNPEDPSDLPTPSISFGFIDYKKTEYSGDRNTISNDYRFVTGKIYAELKDSSLGKPLLNKDDYNYTAEYIVSVKDSGYNVDIVDTGVIVDANTRRYTQKVTMNQDDQVAQLFDICTDGTNVFRKKPAVKLVESRTVNTTVGIIVSITIEHSVEHYINNTLMFTSSFNVNEDGTIWNQKYYYLYSIDLVNKLILAHVYVFDEPNLIIRVEGVVIDSFGEYVIWTYDKYDIPVTTPVNVPPWQLSPIFPAHPQDTGFIGESTYSHREYVWKSPYFYDLGIQVNQGGSSKCGFYYVAIPNGVYFPCTELDEDIRSVVLFNSVHYDIELSGYVQTKQHNQVYPRRNGWIAGMHCCYNIYKGDIDYTYGSDIVIKENGIISNGEYLQNIPDNTLKTYKVV
jgi:hypothetical protein